MEVWREAMVRSWADLKVDFWAVGYVLGREEDFEEDEEGDWEVSSLEAIL